MAREISRSFDVGKGAVVVRIEQWEGGPVEVHTLYLGAPGGCPVCGRRAGVGTSSDVEAEIASRVAAAGQRCEAAKAAMRKAGWRG